MKKLIYLSLIFLVLSITVGYSQNENPLDLAQRIKLLEEQQKILNESYSKRSKLLDRDCELHKEAVLNKTNEIKGSQKNLRESQKNLEDQVSWLNYLFYLITGGSIFGFIIVFITLYKMLEASVHKIAEKRFDNYFNSKKDVINELIQEFMYKQSSSILVLSHDCSKAEFIKEFFEQMKFHMKKIEFKTFDESLNPANVDLVLFDDDDNLLNQELIEQYASKVKPFYFGKKRVNSKVIPAFANSKFQLYGNLINVLRHQTLLT
ncbi:hypothetical protein GMMP15_440014 [Candidatus Magnetomoraceae bacterium gMMP-15]